MSDPYGYDAARTPFGRYGGALAEVGPDNLAAARSPVLDPAAVDEVVLGNANGAGEENRNAARMASRIAIRATYGISAAALAARLDMAG